MGIEQTVQVNGERLWSSLMEMAKIGATPKGGSKRLALTDEDKQARDLFVQWARATGAEITVDPMGNIFARRPGTNPLLAPITTGSHLDTQPTGGKFDGVFGVMCGLEVLRVLHEHDVKTNHPIEIACWTNEEGSRFAPPMVGSGVFADVFSLKYGLSREDLSGATIGQELARINYDGDPPLGHDISFFLEAHIEQGPILEGERKTIGIVSGAQAQRWYEVTITGQDAHAGTTPMDRRRDALVGAAAVITEVNRIAVETPDGRATVGVLELANSSRNTIPGRVFFTVDLRHPKDGILANMAADFSEYLAGIGRENNLELEVNEIFQVAALEFDARVKVAITKSAETLAYDTMGVVSGAGHDACNIAHVAPTGMIFIPCKDGLSHNELEDAASDDVAAGCNVLLKAILNLDEA
jgi:N-carbamoyl-L-amino-acid hydrolase